MQFTRENKRWLSRFSLLYLALPFVIFCIGWLRLSIGLIFALTVLWALWKLWAPDSSGIEQAPVQSIFPAIILIGVWVFLSGIGGYAFQNWDHHWRNAVFRDLIVYDWPVVYAAPDHGPMKALIYYVGYWLPSALVGKRFGWEAANAFLFLWTWLGVALVAAHLSAKNQNAVVKSVLLLIAFSGMDALGAVFSSRDAYPTLWPPIQHLEIWSGNLQYSSFTTQLFWVFNQSVPVWLCAAMIMNGTRRDESAYIWALSFFFAPLAAIGLSFYLVVDWIQQARAAWTAGKSLYARLVGDLRRDVFFAGALIFLVSFLFFSSNTAAQTRGWQSLRLSDALIFFLLEGGLLWLLLAPRLWRDPRWALTGLLLFFIPFIQLGSGRDFVMRASIVPLFYLMSWGYEAIFTDKSPRFLRIAMGVTLLIGALTPLYEINRSVYRTFDYYFVLDKSQRAAPPAEPIAHLEQGGAPEAEHPFSLTADNIQTLKFMDDKLTKNFVANVRQSLYYRYLAPR